ncbi:MAG: hypothetical protein AB1428_05085 [Bacteroidota bacterium]
MKASALLFAAITLAGASGMRAQEPDEARAYFPPPERFQNIKVAKFDRMYSASLNSENNGVVESAIAHCLWAKLVLPEAQFDQIREGLGSLAVFGRTPSIRYKAYLAGLVFDDPTVFLTGVARRYENSDQLFAALSQRFQSVLLGYNDRIYVGPR